MADEILTPSCFRTLSAGCDEVFRLLIALESLTSEEGVEDVHGAGPLKALLVAFAHENQASANVRHHQAEICSSAQMLEDIVEMDMKNIDHFASEVIKLADMQLAYSRTLVPRAWKHKASRWDTI